MRKLGEASSWWGETGSLKGTVRSGDHRPNGDTGPVAAGSMLVEAGDVSGG
jgi:hypothetical protein